MSCRAVPCRAASGRAVPRRAASCRVVSCHSSWIAVREAPAAMWPCLFCIRRLRFDYGEHHGNFFAKLWTAVYPSNIARTAAKLWQNAFRTICNFSFFDAEKKKWRNFCKNFRGRFFFQKSEVLEGLWIFNPRWQMRRKKSLPELPLFLGRLPWRRGKRLNMCFWPWLGIENDFNHLVLWCFDNMVWWYYDTMTAEIINRGRFIRTGLLEKRNSVKRTGQAQFL